MEGRRRGSKERKKCNYGKLSLSFFPGAVILRSSLQSLGRCVCLASMKQTQKRQFQPNDGFNETLVRLCSQYSTTFTPLAAVWVSVGAPHAARRLLKRSITPRVWCGTISCMRPAGSRALCPWSGAGLRVNWEGTMCVLIVGEAKFIGYHLQGGGAWVAARPKKGF